MCYQSFFRLPGIERRHHWKSSSSCLPSPAPTSSRGLLPFSNEAFAPLQLFGNTSICWCTRMHRAYESGSQLHHGKTVLEYLNYDLVNPLYLLWGKNILLVFGMKSFCTCMELYFVGGPFKMIEAVIPLNFSEIMRIGLLWWMLT